MIKVGDKVKFTKEIIDACALSQYDGKEMKVAQIDLVSISSTGQEKYIVSIIYEKVIVSVYMDQDGNFVSNGKAIRVFEPVAEEVPQGTEDDRCKRCGAMGEIKNMSCVCPSCGNVVWGI